MTSEARDVFVWVWLPGGAEPQVAGRLIPAGGAIDFAYGRSYLARADALALYLPELPLGRGRQRPRGDLTVAGCIRDAAPDAWGQRVIVRRLLGDARVADTGAIDLLTYLLESGSERFGALDFQTSPERYESRTSEAGLDDLLDAAERIDAGEALPLALDLALLGGSSLGGARPKAALDDGGRKLIAKFASTTDPYPVVRAEAVAMDLARRVGLSVAPVELVECSGRDVLLVERFDRAPGGVRHMAVSALTILGLDEISGRYATYHDLADVIAERFTTPGPTLREVFARIVFNVLVGNTDDHARNHAALWDGAALTLSPAYDICPQLRTGGEAAQAMAIDRDGTRDSRLATCVRAAPVYGLTPTQARDVIDEQVETIEAQWSDAADRARLTAAERAALWGRAIMNPYAFEGLR
jgi:serine/threonine-protein kinase HipA